jgi:hypothetical protein
MPATAAAAEKLAIVIAHLYADAPIGDGDTAADFTDYVYIGDCKAALALLSGDTLLRQPMQSELVPLFFAEFLLGGPWRSSMWGCLRSFCSMAGISFLGCTVLPGTLLAGNSIFPNLLSHCSLADLPLQHLWTLAPLADFVARADAAHHVAVQSGAAAGAFPQGKFSLGHGFRATGDPLLGLDVVAGLAIPASSALCSLSLMPLSRSPSASCSGRMANFC